MEHITHKEKVGNKPVRISEEALYIIKAHSLEDYPYECCGFLYGAEDNVRFIYLAKPVLNNVTENKERRFEITPKDYLDAERYALEHDLTLLGVYHSHPAHPAVPSIHDLNHAVPYFSYIIASVSKDRVEAVHSWQLNSDGRFEEEEITVKQYREN